MNKCNSILLNNFKILYPSDVYCYNLSKYLYIKRNYCQLNKFKCWKCGVEKKSIYELFCKNCNIIQEPKSKDNFFKLLGINEKYDIDLKSLTKKYRQLQGKLHPDKYSNSSTEEKLISEQCSSIVNTAYNTLQSPINRGLHMLSIKGEKIDENDKNTDKEFLMEIMELNEEVEDAKTPEELLSLNKKNRKELEKISQQLSNAFDSNDIEKAKKILIRMKYFASISAQINNILRERGIVE